MDAIEQAVDAELQKIVKDGVSEDELERAKKRLTTSAVYARDSLGTGARALGAALAIGRTVEDVEAWPDRISAVTAAQVLAAARHVFVETSSVTSLLLPEEKDGKAQ
jgi:zinc protease